MLRNILPAFFIIFSFPASGQEEGRMETDRPDQTETPSITKRHYFQAESGVYLERNPETIEIYHPSSLLKFGITNKFESRLIIETLTARDLSSKKSVTGMRPLKIGGKVNFMEEKGFIPEMSLIAQVGFPLTASTVLKTNYIAPEFRLTFQNGISKFCSLGYNLGAEWDGESREPGWTYTVAPGFDLGKRAYGYIEVFGTLKNHAKPEEVFDGGFAWYFTDNSKADISAGVGLNTHSPQWYVAIGYSFRIRTTRHG